MRRKMESRTSRATSIPTHTYIHTYTQHKQKGKLTSFSLPSPCPSFSALIHLDFVSRSCFVFEVELGRCLDGLTGWG